MELALHAWPKGIRIQRNAGFWNDLHSEDFTVEVPPCASVFLGKTVYLESFYLLIFLLLPHYTPYHTSPRSSMRVCRRCLSGEV